MTILDITDWRQKGKELMQVIEDTCGAQSRSALLGVLPDVIRMKQSQFDDLKLVQKLPTLHQSEAPFYYTKYCVMEIEVVGNGDSSDE